MPEPLKTPFYNQHDMAGGKLVEFAGWSLPIHYGSLVEEHQAVRTDAGVFDVSHMTVSDVRGDSANQLHALCANDLSKLGDNEALYGCLCSDSGGVIDDIIVYRLAADHYRVISNAGTRRAVLDWFSANKVTDCVTVAAGELAMLAVQGPSAIEKVQRALTLVKGPGEAQDVDLSQLISFGCTYVGDTFIARTGYTGEDGVELIVPKALAASIWDALVEAGVTPCGLGARDTLRLEAGMSLYGQDLDDTHTPFESGVGWTVDLSKPDRAFTGRAALEAQKNNGSPTMRIGLELAGRGVLRAGQPVHNNGQAIGEVTSGTYSPSLQKTIGLARVQRASAPKANDNDAQLTVVIRNKPVDAVRVNVPFYRKP